ncbi:aminoacetone oxidase family FAD-binding enzyme [Candidatus Nomurabacteria bacterium]|nr:aminoacetone oxidase family FAD-binding enzyme [Candidatus Kaiserbacteria bacterium]MCB9815258.1 aminoacetone oxidase family FAD-binding enzyme [Candidatus Nomurabacteria bacterium]
MATESNIQWDVIVVGGGPAGMMAAARAAERGQSVLLIEKNLRLGKKLSITGGGRCNVTNNKPIVREMLSEYKDSGKFLFSTFMQHGVVESVAWFKERGVTMIEENEGRLFPESQSAETICKVLEDEVIKQGVKVIKGTSVKSVEFINNTSEFKITLVNLTEFFSISCVVATGGTSRPETGSTGEGFQWLKEMGHSVKKDDLSLVPLALKDKWVAKVSGVTLASVKISLYLDGKKVNSKIGKILFTHFGVSGPTILNMSSEVRDLLNEGSVEIKLDFFPKVDIGELRKTLNYHLFDKSNQKIKNVLADLVPKSLAGVLLDQLKIDGETPGHSLSTEDRKRVVVTLKEFTLIVKGLLGTDKAVIAGGGVDLTEIDFKTMSSKIVPGLYLVGDVLGIDRPSGGYSLQLCWSTGFVAGDSISLV